MPEPLWRQIAEDLRQKIETGQLGRDGQPLPTETELREEYKASRNTIRDAVKWLVTRGLVVTRSGQGTFVARKIEPLTMRLATEPTGTAGSVTSESASSRAEVIASGPRVEILQAGGLTATELRLSEGTTIVSRHKQRFINGVPYSLQTTFYPMSLVEQGAVRLIRAEDIAEGAVTYIGGMLGIKEAGWRDRFTVRIPDTTETAFFSLPDDGRIPVFEIIRTGYDDSCQPFRVTVTTYPADRNQFVMSFGKVPEETTESASVGDD